MFNLDKLLSLGRKGDKDAVLETPTRNDDNNDPFEGFICPSCHSVFPSAEDLMRHFESVHEFNSTMCSNSSLTCPTCSLSFERETELLSHTFQEHGTASTLDQLQSSPVVQSQEVLSLKKDTEEVQEECEQVLAIDQLKSSPVVQSQEVLSLKKDTEEVQEECEQASALEQLQSSSGVEAQEISSLKKNIEYFPKECKEASASDQLQSSADVETPEVSFLKKDIEDFQKECKEMKYKLASLCMTSVNNESLGLDKQDKMQELHELFSCVKCLVDKLIENHVKLQTEYNEKLQNAKTQYEHLNKEFDDVKNFILATKNMVISLTKNETPSLVETSKTPVLKSVGSGIINAIYYLNDELKSRNQTLYAAQEKLSHYERQLQQITDIFAQNKLNLESTLSRELKPENSLEQQTSLVGSVKSTLNTLIADNEKMRVEKEKIIKDLEAAKLLLVNRNMKYEKEMETMKDKLLKETEELKQKVSQLTVEKEKLKTAHDQISSEFNSLQLTYKQKERDWENSAAHYAAQTGVFTENANTLRDDLLAEQKRRERCEKSLDEVTGMKLELEAKLENALEERKALLDRCMKSESENEKLLESSANLRRKHGDAVAALHELGRANQTLQIDNVKHLGRKWADDSEVTHCTACGKAFSVTVRKHHCRKCGNIFCKECSSKTGTVPSSKRPARICDQCSKELSK